MTYISSFVEKYVIRHSESIETIYARYGDILLVLILGGVTTLLFAIWRKSFADAQQKIYQPSPQGNPTKSLDPVAMRTDWAPLTQGGANFCTFRLSKRTPHICEVRPTVLSFIVYLIFFAFGLVFLLAGIHGIFYHLQNYKSPMHINLPVAAIMFSLILNFVFVFVGLFITRIAGFMFYSSFDPVRFDKRTGIYSTSRNPKFRKDCIQLEHIHAIQLLPELNHSIRGHSYCSFELNLILKDARRINVTDHANLKHTLSDSNTLSEFLGVPIWNAIDLECDLNENASV